MSGRVAVMGGFRDEVKERFSLNTGSEESHDATQGSCVRLNSLYVRRASRNKSRQKRKEAARGCRRRTHSGGFCVSHNSGADGSAAKVRGISTYLDVIHGGAASAIRPDSD